MVATFFLALSPPDPYENHSFIVINTEHVDDVDTVKQQVDNYILDQLPEARGRSKKMSRLEKLAWLSTESSAQTSTLSIV